MKRIIVQDFDETQQRPKETMNSSTKSKKIKNSVKSPIPRANNSDFTNDGKHRGQTRNNPALIKVDKDLKKICDRVIGPIQRKSGRGIAIIKPENNRPFKVEEENNVMDRIAEIIASYKRAVEESKNTSEKSRLRNDKLRTAYLVQGLLRCHFENIKLTSKMDELDGHLDYQPPPALAMDMDTAFVPLENYRALEEMYQRLLHTCAEQTCGSWTETIKEGLDGFGPIKPEPPPIIPLAVATHDHDYYEVMMEGAPKPKSDNDDGYAAPSINNVILSMDLDLSIDPIFDFHQNCDDVVFDGVWPVTEVVEPKLVSPTPPSDVELEMEEPMKYFSY